MDYSESKRIADLYSLRLSSGALELRIPYPEEILDLAAKSYGRILDSEEIDYLTPWAVQTDRNLYELGMLQYQVNRLLNMTNENWALLFYVFLDGSSIGAMSLYRGDSDVTEKRTVSSGSWLLKERQGQGYGQRTRSMILQFAFEELGAEFAKSSAHIDNPASNRVSASLGYSDAGIGKREHEVASGADDLLEQYWVLAKNDFRPVTPLAEILIEPELVKFLKF